MANFTIYKKVLMRGEKGDTGGGGIDTTVPQTGIIAYKGDEIPEGYILYSEVPDGVLTHITATYTQTATITDASSLDELRPDLVVKAYYYDEETGVSSDYVVTDYTLSGTLEVGTSTITASYKGFTDSFDVIVEDSINYIYKWDLTQSLTDQKQGKALTLGGNAIQDGSGVHFTGKGDRLIWSDFDMANKTFEIDFATVDFQGNANYDMNFFVVPTVSSDYGCILCFIKTKGWAVYSSTTYQFESSNNRNLFNGKTVKLVCVKNSDYYYSFTLYIDGEKIGEVINKQYNRLGTTASIGSANKATASNGDQCYNMTITGIRVYANQ